MDLSIEHLLKQYRAGRAQPAQVLERIQERIYANRHYNAWISLLPERVLEDYLRTLAAQDPAALPLYGIPFAVKDNIDVQGLPTTAACPEIAYLPEQSAFAVRQLVQAGAIPLGKTNLDQFATGLTGTRSPHGAVRNSVRPDYIAGGSSSGSALAVALGQASFALGTDTAGSGRVPAAFNQLIGYKPTRGLVDMHGVIPACRTLDCMSVFAANCADIGAVLRVLATPEVEDGFSLRGERRAALLARLHGDAGEQTRGKFIFGVPDESDLYFFGHGDYRQRYAQVLESLSQSGWELRRIDFSPFIEAASLLYEGPWLAERQLAVASQGAAPDALRPELRSILEGARDLSALDVFNALYRLQDLKRQADLQLSGLDFVLTPTVGGCYTRAEVDADPLRRNSDLGYYTNFMNLLDYAAVAIPGDEPASRIPFGLTLFAASGSDALLLRFAAQVLERLIPECSPVAAHACD